MKDYYTERTYSNSINRSINNNYTSRINFNSLFRNFLVDENVDDSKKFFVNKKKEILPSYTNIKERIEEGRKDIKSKFNIESTLFREIQLKDLVSYSNFAKKISQYFFGPNGIITKRNINLKKFHKSREKKQKENFNTKIYAGTWLYLDENPKYTRFLARLKSNRKKILNIGGNFSTEDDYAQKLHNTYLKGSRKNKLKEIKEEKTPEKNIFEFTTINRPYNIKKALTQRKYINKDKINHLLLNTSPNFFEKNSRNINSIEQKRNKTMYNDKFTSRKKSKIKTIYLRERLFEKENKKKKKYFSNIKLTINKKLDTMNNPIRNMKKEIYLIKKNNKVFHTFGENKEKYKEDIKVIGEDDQKDTDDFMDNFIKKAYKIHLQNRKNYNPRKIFFTYYENKGNTARESLKKFMRNIEKIKDEERKIKYGKSIRDIFKNNIRTIEHLGKELDELKIKNKRLFDN